MKNQRGEKGKKGTSELTRRPRRAGNRFVEDLRSRPEEVIKCEVVSDESGHACEAMESDSAEEEKKRAGSLATR